MAKYIIRFDDITPKMDWELFSLLHDELMNLGIKSILGVVPDNQDSSLNVSDGVDEEQFWDRIRSYKQYGDTIAQHGTFHVYLTNDSGLMGINNNSEFSGLSYEEQYTKLRQGKKILEKEGVWEPFFMAPSHSFDLNTLKALRALNFEAITDGYGLYPYEINGIILVPQLISKPIPKLPIGVQTICLHTNSMNKENIKCLRNFIRENHTCFIDFKLTYSNVKNNTMNTLSRISTQFILTTLRKIR
ncbi:DUF2334 domain-containing protein [Wohlfahrtiimonas chitiniclastica]|uniref:DUF2334 domain-containing protein n=1 Tax=Wohlfahrtiimonas chitiniclastica TaxID=400946 RepID=UPI0007B69900|nr:DUF2334 domain-containing protein [Wohlfahrtiimonas chitiniclastica]KZX36411.1 hypothetical protein A6V30_08445 [Wohlfahrtiimonas chitiniclastica]